MAEDAGWDGIFVGDAFWCIDPLIQLAACAMTTNHLRLGTMVLCTPLRIPRHLASESLAIDHLSNGRLTLGLATGATWMGWKALPDETLDTKARAEMLDETIDVLTLMYQSKQFDFDGKHYHYQLSLVEEEHYPPKSVQQPRIPLWVPGIWPRMKNMKRALKCDGVLPQKMDAEGKFIDLTPQDISEVKAYVTANRTLTTPFDIVVEGKATHLPKAEQCGKVLPWVEAGATWWIESLWGLTEEQTAVSIRQGPPKIDY